MLATITIASRPTPNHPSCRSTTVPPARPTCSVESVIALSTTRPHVPPSNGQSTFWSSRRSMPITGSSSDLHGRHLLEEDRVEDPPGDGRRHLAALTAALDEDDDDDLGVAHGREGREPGVVLSLLGLGVRDHLSGARLARNVDPWDLRADAGAVVHHGPERLAQERPHRGRELDVAGHLSRIAVEHATIRTLDALDESRLPEHAAVGDGGHEAGDLQRRHEHLALPDRHVDDVTALPRFPAPLGLRDQAEFLAPELDPRCCPEAEGARVFRDGGASDLEPGLVVEDVAGLGQRALEIDAAVSTLLPVLERPRSQMELTVAVHAIHRGQRGFLQPGRGHHDLEDGPRGVLALDGTVQQGMLGILNNAEPRRPVDRPGEPIDLERRRRDERADVAATGVHDHDRAGLAFHRLFGGFLDAPVDGRDDLRAGMRIGVLHHAHGSAQRVDLDPLATVTAAQELVEQPLEPALSDHVAPAVASTLQLLVVGLAHVAEQVRGETAVGIGPLRLDLDDHTGQLELPLLDLRHVFERQPAPHPHGEERVGWHAGDRLFQLLVGDLEQRRDAAEDGIPTLVLARELARNEREGESRAIVDERHAVLVEEDAARGRHRANADPVLVRGVEEVTALEHLQIPELADDDEEGAHDGDGDRHDPGLAPIATVSERCAVAHAAGCRWASAQARARTRAAPRKPLYSACGSTTYAINSPNGAGK